MTKLNQLIEVVGSRTKEVRGFGVQDKKGREIGGRMITFEADLVFVEGKMSGWSKPEGRYFMATPHATRDGDGFGASQGYQWFTTAEARDSYVARYWREASKRAQKIAG